jgi:hypothetical protein
VGLSQRRADEPASGGASWNSGSATASQADSFYVAVTGTEATATTVGGSMTSGTKVHDAYTGGGDDLGNGLTPAAWRATHSRRGSCRPCDFAIALIVAML